ncbi:hypothetical protein FACS189440_06840 [Bacteroidia bacterium]|nr:hypothetical protein FACS189440_06840 [Bacteroidia bacterium]
MSKIQNSDLKAGDILLYHGKKSWISKAIRKLDGTEYNHAAIYDGEQVIEALSKGIVEKNIADSITDSDPVTVLRLNPEQADMLPVVTVAKNYLGKPYAYEQILLLVVICLFRKIKMNKIVAKVVEFILEKTAVLLLNTFVRDGKDALICSELVYRSYNEADKTEGTYKIHIDRTSEKSGFTQSVAEEGSLYSRLFGNAIEIMPNVGKAGFMLTNIISEEECEKLVDELVDDYKEELLDTITEQRLKAAAENLFATIDASKQEKGNAFIAGKINIFDIIKALGADGSDFVTPGDLWKAQNTNLTVIGDIK